MRWRMVVANGIVMVLVGLILLQLLWSRLGDEVANRSNVISQAKQSIAAVSVQMQLDAMHVERWLTSEADKPAAREPFEAAVASARGESATKQANRMRDVAMQAPSLAHLQPAIIAFVDVRGVTLGRNGNNLMRGEDIGAAHPEMKDAIAHGRCGSEVWFAPSHAQQWFVSYAPVKSGDGAVLGGIIYGTPVNDERLTTTAKKTGGGAIALILEGAKGFDIPAKSKSLSAQGLAMISAGETATRIASLAQSDAIETVVTASKDWVVVATRLEGYGGPKAMLVRVTPSSPIDLFATLFYPIGVAIMLGLVMVAIGNWLLGSYFVRPINEIENGLLQVLSGNSSWRIDIEHAALGGLAWRINSLLNHFMGVADTVAAEQTPGIPDRALSQSLDDSPTAREQDQGLRVVADQIDAQVLSAEALAALKQEPAEAYYARLFREYAAAKQRVDQPLNMSEPQFTEHIRSEEQSISQKEGRAVRFVVQVQQDQVVLIAARMP